MTTHYPIDDVDFLPRAELKEVQARGVLQLLSRAGDLSPFYKDKLPDLDTSVIGGDDPLGSLPPTSRDELVQAQREAPPWGGTLAVETASCSIIGFTSAITAGLEGREGLRLAATAGDMRRRAGVAVRGFRMGGAGPGDVTAVVGEVARSLLHHGFLGALSNIGATPFQTGRGLTLRHVRHTLPSLAPTQVVTHPTYAMHLARLLEEEGVTLPVERLFLWGETGPSVPSVRASIEGAWHHARVRDVYAMEELGVLAAGCEAGSGLHCFEDMFVYEVVDPASGEVLGPGERGELVVTPLHAGAMPLLRYRTGDLVVTDDGVCPCGGTHVRMHVLGRVVPTADGGARTIELARVEELLGRLRSLWGLYRVVLEGEEAFLEVPLAALDQDVQAVAITTALLAARSTGVELRPVKELPAFLHRAVRVVGAEDIAWWEALAGEQGRLEG